MRNCPFKTTCQFVKRKHISKLKYIKAHTRFENTQKLQTSCKKEDRSKHKILFGNTTYYKSILTCIFKRDNQN